MSEKLDGIRAYWNGTHLISRDGKIIYAPKWFTKNYPPFEIDGELWTKIGTGFSDELRKNPPMIGSEVTFKYQGMTKYGKPRFPVYLRVRENKI